MVDLGHWEGVLEESTNLPYGFIYKITNLTNDKKYIGKKQCQSIRKRPPLKGKKNKRHEKIETDWKTYTSSSNELNILNLLSIKSNISLLSGNSISFQFICSLLYSSCSNLKIYLLN